jgi:hypothetical protein
VLQPGACCGPTGAASIDRVDRIFVAKGTGHIAGTLTGFPDLHFEIEQLIAEGGYRLAGGKLAEQWVVMDALGLLQQLGAVPGPG